MAGDHAFTVWDYVVFGGMMLISCGIGVYHAARGSGRTTSDFLTADRSLSCLPVGLSVLASFFSASTLLGTPAEVYLRGTMYWMAVFGAVCAPLFGAFVFGPFFYNLKVVSVFEYLEKRYNSRAVRRFGAFIFIIRTIIGMGIVLYGPSIALSAVTDFPLWAGIVSMGAVCTFYTTLGGMKAVIWTDVFQTCIMLAGMLAIIIQGSIEVGGLTEVWRIAKDGDRIDFFNFDVDPRVRHTFWSLVIGNCFVWLMPYTVDQQMVQRFSSAKSLKQAKIAVLLNIPGMFVLITLCSFTGVVMYAYYSTCDPLSAEYITEQNQLLPWFMLEVLHFAPGLPGLFTAALFSGALSSVSSMLNALVAVTWEDFLKWGWSSPVSEGKSTCMTKCLVVLYGGIGVGVAWLVGGLGGTVLQMSITFNGAIGAPLVGIFLLAAFFPCANAVGTVVGGVVGFALPMWISIGAYISKPDVMDDLPLSVSQCPTPNFTTTATYWQDYTTQIYSETTAAQQVHINGIEQLYTVSYLWMSAIGTVTTVIIGSIVSLCSGGCSSTDVHPSLLISYVDTCWCCLPLSCRECLRCETKSKHMQDKKEVLYETQNEGNDHIKMEDTLQGQSNAGFQNDSNIFTVDISENTHVNSHADSHIKHKSQDLDYLIQDFFRPSIAPVDLKEYFRTFEYDNSHVYLRTREYGNSFKTFIPNRTVNNNNNNGDVEFHQKDENIEELTKL